MAYTYTVLKPETLVFRPEYRICSHCGRRIQEHIHCDGARWHVLSFYGTLDGKGHRRCSEPDCEVNHGKDVCEKENQNDQ